MKYNVIKTRALAKPRAARCLSITYVSLLEKNNLYSICIRLCIVTITNCMQQVSMGTARDGLHPWETFRTSLSPRPKASNQYPPPRCTMHIICGKKIRTVMQRTNCLRLLTTSTSPRRCRLMRSPVPLLFTEIECRPRSNEGE